jgi:hypothetical protein
MLIGMARQPTRTTPTRCDHDVSSTESSHHATTLTRAWLVGLILLITGCANPLQRQASADCDPEAYRIFPQVIQSQRVTEPVMVQVMDGTQHCVTELLRPGDRTSAVTRCVPNVTLQTRWVDRSVNVDLNAKERNIWHERCVQQLCVERVGNTKCEAPSETNSGR